MGIPIKEIRYIPPGVEQTIESRAQSPEHYITVYFSVSSVSLNSD